MPDAKSIVQNWVRSFETKDVDRILEPLADDVEFRAESMPEPLKGKETLRTILGAAMPSYARVAIEPVQTIADGANVAILGRAHGTFDADAEILGERLSTKGKDIDVLAAMFVHVNDDGRIDRVTRVRDTWSIMRQLDLPPEQMEGLMARIGERFGSPSPPSA